MDRVTRQPRYNWHDGTSTPAIITEQLADGTAEHLVVFHERGPEVLAAVPRGGEEGLTPAPGTWTWAEKWEGCGPPPAAPAQPALTIPPFGFSGYGGVAKAGAPPSPQFADAHAEVRRLSKREGELLASRADALGRIEVMEQNRRTGTTEKERLADALCSILSKHTGERGDNEGAVETLERVLVEREQARRALMKQQESSLERQAAAERIGFQAALARVRGSASSSSVPTSLLKEAKELFEEFRQMQEELGRFRDRLGYELKRWVHSPEANGTAFCYTPEDVAALIRERDELMLLRKREPTREEMEAVLREKTEALLGGTIRRCIGSGGGTSCGRPVFGGPTRCGECAGKFSFREALERQTAEVERLQTKSSLAWTLSIILSGEIGKGGPDETPEQALVRVLKERDELRAKVAGTVVVDPDGKIQRLATAEMASRVENLQRQLVDARAQAAMLRERLAAVEWENTESDEDGVAHNFCPECGGAKHGKGHESDCRLRLALDQTGDNPAGQVRGVVSATCGEMPPQSVAELQRFAESAMAMRGPDFRICLRAADLVNVLKAMQPKTGDVLRTVTLKAVREAVERVSLEGMRHAKERTLAAAVSPVEACNAHLLQAEHEAGVADGAARVLRLVEESAATESAANAPQGPSPAE